MAMYSHHALKSHFSVSVWVSLLMHNCKMILYHFATHAAYDVDKSVAFSKISNCLSHKYFKNYLYFIYNFFCSSFALRLLMISFFFLVRSFNFHAIQDCLFHFALLFKQFGCAKFFPSNTSGINKNFFFMSSNWIQHLDLNLYFMPSYQFSFVEISVDF